MEYRDLNGYPCRLFFEQGQSQFESKHVLVIAKWQGDWLLTKHRERGLEFPGGKAETGETLEQAAQRELYEETGAKAEQFEWLAEYTVHTDAPFCKTVYTAVITDIDDIVRMETEGPVFVPQLDMDERYSFLMRDMGMEELLKKVNQLEKWRN